MAVKIGHASIDERKKISGGKAGDQTGKEVCIRDWYNKPWNVMLICTDAEVAKVAAAYMKAICEDDDFGYDQGQRTTGYLGIVNAKGNVSKATPGEFDCSSLVASCYKLAGLNVNVNCTTRNLRAALLATGKFVAYTDSAHLSSDAYATVGAVYLKEGSHVVMSLGTGSKAAVSATTNKPDTTIKPTTTSFEKNEVVMFNGNSHYTSATGDKKSSCKPGKATITLVKKGAKHPYHCIRIEGEGSTVYGWVNASDVSAITTNSNTPVYVAGKTYTLQVELKVRTGAGVSNTSAKTHSQLTANDKKYDKDKDGALDSGTKVVCKAVKTVGSDIWIKTSSGWIAAFYKGKIYIK